MGRAKPNKQRITKQNNEQNKQTQKNVTQSVTPHIAKATTKLTQTETIKEPTEKRAKAHKRYVRNRHDIPYYKGDAT
jgi:hypothetical protein